MKAAEQGGPCGARPSMRRAGKVSSAGPRRARPRVPSAEQPLSQTPPAGCDPPDGCGEVTGSERPRAPLKDGSPPVGQEERMKQEQLTFSFTRYGKRWGGETGEMALELAQDLFWGRDRLIRNEFVLMKRFVCRR